MKTIARFLICAAVSACLVEHPAAQQRGAFAPPEARIDNATGNAALTLPSTASPRAVLAQYLRGRGRSESTVQSLVEVSRGSGRDSITHARFEQRIGGLPVFGTYARAALDARGEQWEIHAPARGAGRFQEGPATAVALARTGNGGGSTDAHQWLVRITLIEEQ